MTQLDFFLFKKVAQIGTSWRVTSFNDSLKRNPDDYFRLMPASQQGIEASESESARRINRSRNGSGVGIGVGIQSKNGCSFSFQNSSYSTKESHTNFMQKFSLLFILGRSLQLLNLIERRPLKFRWLKANNNDNNNNNFYTTFTTICKNCAPDVQCTGTN